MRPMTYSYPERNPGPQAEPIATPNTTPLIDVMLVLLIMMILAIPASLHKMTVDLPGSGVPGVPPPVHQLSLAADGAIAVDGQHLSEARFKSLLAAFRADPARPVLHIRADADIPYGRFHARMADIRKAGITRVGFVGQSELRKAIT